ncbi:MAG TPA: hypothetical protein VFH61_10090 [Thermoleophilia bacterium]|nr:hypothetical protein [Thermoleophilia bacterium]
MNRTQVRIALIAPTLCLSMWPTLGVLRRQRTLLRMLRPDLPRLDWESA